MYRIPRFLSPKKNLSKQPRNEFIGIPTLEDAKVMNYSKILPLQKKRAHHLKSLTYGCFQPEEKALTVGN